MICRFNLRYIEIRDKFGRKRHEILTDRSRDIGPHLSIPFVRPSVCSSVLLSGCHHQFCTFASVITLSLLLLLPINNFKQRQETPFKSESSFKQLIVCITFRNLSLECRKPLYMRSIFYLVMLLSNNLWNILTADFKSGEKYREMFHLFFFFL